MKQPYEKLALRTNAPVDAARSRITLNALCLLHQTASSTLLAALDADNLKRHLFYGKGEVPVFAESYAACIVEKLKVSGRNWTFIFTDQEINLLHSALGQVTESAEFLESVVKTLLDDKPLDKVNLAEEIGDSQWYHAIAADALGTTFDIIQDLNIKKLQKRYPDKFCEEKAVGRDLDAERRVLESAETPVTQLPDGSGCFTATIMSKEEAMALPLKERPLNFRISSEIYHAVFEAVGAASMCWKPRPGNQVSSSEEASKVAVDLCFKIADEIEKQPLRADYDKVRSALVAIVGADGREELAGIATAIRLAAPSQREREIALIGIHALRDTLPA